MCIILACIYAHIIVQSARHGFHAAAVLLARKQKERAPLTKAQLAAKARKRALKAPKNVYDSEKMPLNDAISVLRVCYFDSLACSPS